MNLAFTIIFTIDMGLKLIGYGFTGYAQDVMNVLDGSVVLLSLAELAFMSKGGSVSAFRSIRIFRTFRVLRVTRLIRSLEYMSIIIDVFAVTIEQFTYMFVLMLLFIYIYSLIGFQIFCGKFDGYSRTDYDTFYFSFLAAFQVLTLENWNDILESSLKTYVSKVFTFFYLISNIIIGNYIILNLYLAILLAGFKSTDTNSLGEQITVEEEKEDEPVEH